MERSPQQTGKNENTDVIVFPSTSKIEVMCLFSSFIERLIGFDLNLIKMQMMVLILR